jgi:hypothetical protein
VLKELPLEGLVQNKAFNNATVAAGNSVSIIQRDEKNAPHNQTPSPDNNIPPLLYLHLIQGINMKVPYYALLNEIFSIHFWQTLLRTLLPGQWRLLNNSYSKYL